MLSQQNIKFSLKRNSILSVAFILVLGLFNNPIFSQSTKFKVVLDAGHGGKDSGTPGLKSFKNSYERNVVLKVTNKVAALLKKEHDIKTILTRKNNTFVELHKRGKIANKADADLFISIHCDAAGNKKAYGASTYVLGMGKTAKNLEVSKRENQVILLEDDNAQNYSSDRNSPEFIIGLTLMQEQYLDKSIEFAGIVQGKFKTVAKRKNRGVHQGNLAVLYYTYMPSVLIELGFLTNKNEERFLNTNLGQNKMAEAIYKAILTYKGRIENNSVETIDIIDDYPSTTITTNTASNSKKYYKIQFASSRKKIETKPYNFKGLSNIERVKVGQVYKYFYGVTTDLAIAKKMRLKVVKKGYKDAFIAKFNFDKSNGNIYKLNYEDPFKKKKKTTVKSKKTSPKSVVNPSAYNDVTFKVQFVSSPKKIETKSYNFKGLKNVKRVKVGRYYKYYYGESSDYSFTKKMHRTAIKKGYKDAFIIAQKNGKNISVREALR